jgi:hypothetical protein
MQFLANEDAITTLHVAHLELLTQRAQLIQDINNKLATQMDTDHVEVKGLVDMCLNLSTTDMSSEYKTALGKRDAFLAPLDDST